jgi:hypothetical protein
MYIPQKRDLSRKNGIFIIVRFILGGSGRIRSLSSPIACVCPLLMPSLLTLNLFL